MKIEADRMLLLRAKKNCNGVASNKTAKISGKFDHWACPDKKKCFSWSQIGQMPKTTNFVVESNVAVVCFE